MPAELITLLTAATPVSELRGAIPLGLGLGLSPLAAYLFAVLGNSLIVLPLLLFLRHGSRWLMARSPWAKRILEKVFERTRRRHGARFEAASFVALAVFVAVPLPLTGAWTACIGAFLFNIPLWKAMSAIVLGVVVAGLVVLGIAQGIIHIF